MAPSKPEPHFPPSHPRAAAIPRPSRTSFLIKSLFFALLLALLPLFPSKPPESLHRTIFADFWELLHLLFIGVVVSYGLFSHRRKNTDNRVEICSNVADFESYGDRLFRVSSVFEDDFEVPFGSEEKNGSVFGEQKNLENGFGYKPLGLPVRSLKSRARNSDRSEFITRSVKLGELGPLNLEKRFSEEVALPSPIPWRSRSGRMEMRENVDNYTRPLHSRNFSVEESGFERRKSDSYRSTKSLRSRRSSISEFPDLEIKELERKKSFHGSSSSTDVSSSSKEINGKNSLNASNSWRNGNSCLSEKVARESFETESKKSGRKKSFYGSSSSPDSSSSSKEINGKNSVNASNSWRNGDSCLSEKDARESFETESKKLGRKKSCHGSSSSSDLSSSSKEIKGTNSVNASNSWRNGDSCLSEKDARESFETESKKSGRKKSFHGSSTSPDSSSSSKEIKGKNSVNASNSWRNGDSCLSEKDARESFETESKKLGLKKSFHGSSTSPDSSSSSKEINGKNSVNASNSWRNGDSCLSEKDARESFETESKKLGQKKSFHGSSTSPDSSSSSKEINGKNSVNASNSWGYGSSCLSEKNARERCENVSKESSKREDSSLKSEVKLSPPEYAPNDGNHDRLYNSGHTNKPIRWETSESKNEMLQKSANFVKASSRGKSVRTIRASGYSTETMKFGDTCGNPSDIIGSFSKPKSTFSDYQKGEKQEVSENLCVEDEEEDCESEAEVFQVSSEEEEVASDADADAVSDDCDEVDKKAGEFIANFREQIRLQKVASFKRSGGWLFNFSCFW